MVSTSLTFLPSFFNSSHILNNPPKSPTSYYFAYVYVCAYRYVSSEKVEKIVTICKN